MKGPNPIQFASKRRIAIFSGGLLLAILLFVIFQTRVELFSALRSVFVRVLLLSLAGFICQTFGWGLALGKMPLSLLKMKLGGAALNQISTMIPLRGDTLNLVQLKKRYDIKDAVDSLVRDRGIGLLSLFLGIPLLKRRGGFFTAISLRLPVSEAVRGGCEETDRVLNRFMRDHRGRFFLSLLFHLLANGFLVAEVYWIGVRLHDGFSFLDALIVGGLIPLLYKALTFIPNAMGVLEAVVGGLLVLLLGPGGWSAAIGLQAVRRIKGFFWFLVGLGLVGNPSKAMS